MDVTLVKVIVKPNARAGKYQWLDDFTLKVDVPAPPEKNKANEWLIQYLSQKLSLKEQDIVIKGGKTSRYKFLYIKMKLDKIRAILK